MNSASKRKTISAIGLSLFVANRHSCVRARQCLIILTAVISIGFAAVSMLACSGKKVESESNKNENTPAIVSLCKSIDYTDTASLHKSKVMAAHMKDIVKMMMRSDSAATAMGLEIFFNGLDNDKVSLRSASHYAYLYLSNPNSTIRNETLYLRFLSSLLSRKDLPEDITARAQENARRTMINRPGTMANDFRYIDRDGKQGTLHSVDAEQTMLIFYDPECPHCPEILQRIAENPKVNAAINAGSLRILAVYAEGKRDVWEKRKSDLPESWTVAYDLTGVLDADLYDLPAMPIVYLLDSDKRVLVKDMPW